MRVTTLRASGTDRPKGVQRSRVEEHQSSFGCRKMRAEKQLKVAVVQRRLAHYRIPLYDRINDANQGISLTVFCGNSNGSGISGIQVKDPPYVVRLATYNWSALGKSLLFQPAAMLRVFKGGFDVVVCEGSLTLATSIALLAFRRIFRQKNVLWLKGWPSCRADRRLIQLVKKAFLRLAHHYIVYGEESRVKLVSLAVLPERITVAQNTLDTTRLLAGNKGDPFARNPAINQILLQSSPYVFNIGRHVAQKRVTELLKAFEILQSAEADFDISLVIAGTGPETASTSKSAQILGLKNVYFVGTISEQEAEVLFLGSLCCVFPGAVGLAVVQAMASGKPVICADEAGADSELVLHGINGLRYEPGNVRELARCLTEVIHGRNLRTQLGKCARETIKTRATIANMAEKWMHAIRSVQETSLEMP